jgi:hypothetical protein
MKWRLIGVLPVAIAALAIGGGAQATTQSIFNGRIAFTDVTGIASMNPDGSGQWGLDLVVGDNSPAWSPRWPRRERSEGTDLLAVLRLGSDVVARREGDCLHQLSHGAGSMS